jgi:sulfur relay (sulfurtransferase) complex TusBCD TusD component (DsrE family)
LRFGFLLASAEPGDVALLARLAAAAIDGGHDVRVFLMDDGVSVVGDPALAALAERGVELALCASDADARGACAPDVVTLGSQLDHAGFARDCDRWVTLA